MRCESCYPERTLEPKAIEKVEESRGKIRHPGGPKASWSVAIGLDSVRSSFSRRLVSNESRHSCEGENLKFFYIEDNGFYV